MPTVGQASETEPAVVYYMCAAIGIALYNALETVVLIFATFKIYRGAYFWSLLITSIGLFVTTLGFCTFFFNLIKNRFGQSTVTIIGWYFFTVGQSVVLWSRLHLVILSEAILRGVIVMIITTAVLFLIPTTVFAFYYNVQPPREVISQGYQIMENIQVTGFSVQEILISALYIWGTLGLLGFTTERRKRNLIIQLFIMNVILILLDCVVMGIQYAGFRILQIATKYLVWSLKLKLEIAVLSRLINFFQTSTATCGTPMIEVPPTGNEPA